MVKEFKVLDNVRIVTSNAMMNGKERIHIWILKRPQRPQRYLLRIDFRRYSSWAGWKLELKDTAQGIPQEIIDAYIDDCRYRFWWVDAFRVDRETESVLSSDGKYHDKHYGTCVVEPIVAMQALLTAEQFKGFLMGNALKYRLRAGHKEDAQKDIDKALRYEQWLHEYEQEGEITT